MMFLSINTATDICSVSLYNDKKFKWNDQTCVKSKRLGDNLISLPIYPDLKMKEVDYICEKIKEFFKN